MEDRLTQAIQNADGENGCFALMFRDLNGFKVSNDAYGHHVGDLLLVEVAQRIGATVRTSERSPSCLGSSMSPNRLIDAVSRNDVLDDLT